MHTIIFPPTLIILLHNLTWNTKNNTIRFMNRFVNYCISTYITAVCNFYLAEKNCSRTYIYIIAYLRSDLTTFVRTDVYIVMLCNSYVLFLLQNSQQ